MSNLNDPWPIAWETAARATYALCTFTLPGGLLSPGALPGVQLPSGLDTTRGIVFSGRGPAWLYACLVLLAHPFAWVGVHDPRLGGAIVVQRHQVNAPGPGYVVSM